MIRVLFAVTLVASFGVAHAQDGGAGAGAGAGGAAVGGTGGATTGTVGDAGGIDTSDFGGIGIQAGPTEQTVSGFAASEDNGFAGVDSAATNFRARTFTGGQQAREVVIGGSSQTQRQVRPSFRLGFTPSAALLARNRQRARFQFNSIAPRVRELRGMSINTGQNGAVTVRGQATSRYGSLLASAVARLQPGVRSVRNEIRIISPTAPRAQPAPARAQPAPARATPIAPAIPSPIAPTRPNLPVITVPTPQPSTSAPTVLPLPPLPPLAPGR